MILRFGGAGTQFINGSPVYPAKHEQIGVWLITLHCAPIPHAPGQGSLHFSLMHALSLEHSELIEHSGRQFGGIPIYASRQEQDGIPLIFLHCEWMPQGDG